jgi:hypothetical protein
MACRCSRRRIRAALQQQRQQVEAAAQAGRGGKQHGRAAHGGRRQLRTPPEKLSQGCQGGLIWPPRQQLGASCQQAGLSLRRNS